MNAFLHDFIWAAAMQWLLSNPTDVRWWNVSDLVRQLGHAYN